MENSCWSTVLERMADDIGEQAASTWLRSLQVIEHSDRAELWAPNAIIAERVAENYKTQIQALYRVILGTSINVVIRQGDPAHHISASSADTGFVTNLDHRYTFENFVAGSSNQLAHAASLQVSENPGGTNNPLMLYGGTGLGKTHLLHAIGNALLGKRANARVLYLHSETFVNDMIVALRHGRIDAFKTRYRSLDALLIDDIQFFAGKDRTQEEFFHTFNSLVGGNQQVVLTCDRYPKEVDGLEARLKSRFGWGLTVSIEPPDFETRVNILLSKAGEKSIALPEKVAFFVAKNLRSNVRELEGALNSLAAHANFRQRSIDEEFARETLRDLLNVQERQVSTMNIQKVVATYYGIRVSDLLSKKRTRSIARPRQIGMRLAKDLTNQSLPEIGDAFGGRDHTTVLHACRKVQELIDSDAKLREDFMHLTRELTT